MRNLFYKIIDKFKKSPEVEAENPEYLEVTEPVEEKSKIIVRPFILEDFEDVKQILDVLRAGYTIALINVKPLKDRDIVELKRAIAKLKKTTDALNGDIAGFGEDYIIVTPSFAEIYRKKETSEEQKKVI